MSDVQSQIGDLVKNNDVVLFMKGNRNFPQCGFSARVIQILNEYLDTLETVNVLADPNMRSGIKEYSNWPTIPQLYVKGEFIGGCDIVTELHETGELAGTLGVTLEEIATPELTVTPAAVEAITGATQGEGQQSLRFSIGAQFNYDLQLDSQKDGDIVITSNGITVLMDRGSAKRANGTTIDYQTSNTGAGFVITNPNEPPRVKQVSADDVKALMDDKADFTLFDVREAEEREICLIEGAVHLTQANIEEHLANTPKDRQLVFHCHHGGRSQQAADFFLSRGYTDVSNMSGGIAAWADSVDPDMSRY